MPKGYFTPYTKAQEDFIKENYLKLPVKQIANKTNSTFGRVSRFLRKNNLVIPAELVKQRQLASRKQKGDVPFNKGLQQSEYMSPEAIENTKKTRFKKGVPPKNILPIGTEVKTKEGYILVKIASPNKWMLKHRKIYKDHHQIQLKSTDNVIFLDGDNQNFNINNLKLISNVENMYRNSKLNYPKQIIPTLLLINNLKKEITYEKQS